MLQVPKWKLNNGTYIPILGLSTWQGSSSTEAAVGQAVREAIDIGYRHFECAQAYGNERIIGDAIAEKIADGSVKREDLFISSKLGITNSRPDFLESALKESLKNLRLDYLDLYLIDWPFGLKEGDEIMPNDSAENLIHRDVYYVDMWKAMEKVYKKELVKSIGVSNCNSLQIGRILKYAKVVPVVNQVECHPYLNQKELRDFCQKQGIVVTAYSPFGSSTQPWQRPRDPDMFNDTIFKDIAERYQRTPAQVLLRYQTQLKNVVISKLSNKEKLAQNIDIFDFQLKFEDIAALNKLDCNWRICPVSEKA